MNIRGILPRSVRRRALLSSRLLLRIMNFESVLDESGLCDLRQLLDITLCEEGDIVECGCNRCGTSIIMADYLRSRGSTKTIYGCDTFEGFSSEELKRQTALGKATVSRSAFAAPGQYEYVQKKLLRLGLHTHVIPIKGFFQDTFPRWLDKWAKLSFVFVDCDLEDSMLFCARTLWPLVVPGGVMAFDDYRSEQFKGARVAIDKFIVEAPHGLASHTLMRRLYLLRKEAANFASPIIST